MRAVFRASFAARRKAWPTPAAKLSGRLPFVRVFVFTDFSPVIGVHGPNCPTPPSCRPKGVDALKVPPAPSEPPNDVSPRHIMAALAHPGSDALREAIAQDEDRKSTRLNSSHLVISYAVFCLKKKNTNTH